MDAAVGLGALGFWLFLAAIIVASIWTDARKKESQQETLRRVVESGQQVDAAMIDRMLSGSANDNPDRELKVAGIIMFFIALGLPVFGWFLGQFEEKLFTIMLGVGLLVGLIGLGLYIAGKMTERWQREDQG